VREGGCRQWAVNIAGEAGRSVWGGVVMREGGTELVLVGV
jgi:hypothetical protein